MLKKISPLLTFLAILVVWEAGTRLGKVPEFILPAPSVVAAASVGMTPGAWFSNIFATLYVALAGFFLALAVSLVIAISMVLTPQLRRNVYPILVVIHSTPIVAIAPIIVVMLGTGNLSRISITFLIAFFPLVVSGVTGMLDAPEEVIELSRSLRASDMREVVGLRLPYAVSHIFAALKVSVTLSVIGAVVAEFVAANEGLGYMIMFATSNFRMPFAFASLAILVVISLGLFGLVTLVQRTFFRWSLP